MDLYAIVLVLFALCSHHVGHNGVEGDMSLFEKEDLLLEKQLKHLNKPAIKTIHNDYGDIYDCVDFYKQPAFDHPLLKNHTFHFQMKPTSLVRRKRDQVSSKASNPLLIGLKGKGCPIGTVPIRRTTKEDLIRQRLASKITPVAYDTIGANYAVAYTSPSPNMYSGAGAILSVHQPLVVGKQYSAGRLLIQNGPDSIQAGWRVDPSLYGDNRSRLFIRVDSGQSHCFNTQCPGFVIVNTEIPVDSILEQVSQRGGQVVATEIYIIQDQPNGNWWLELGKDNTQIGFWPKKIFSGLANLASYVEWGGEVFSVPGTPKPAMGSGFTPIEDTQFDAFFMKIAIISASGQTMDPNTKTFANKGFSVIDEGNQGHDFGHLVLYGGPGGS